MTMSMSLKGPKSSHKKNRPFDFKLIDLVEPHPILYQRQSGLSTFDAMKIKNDVWKRISIEMQHSIQFCMMRWNNLRGQFQKEMRRCRELCPKSGVIRGSSWAYLERLRFLENTVQFNKKYSESDCVSVKEEDDDMEDEREFDVEVEEHFQAISKLDDEDDEATEVGWEYFDSESAVNDNSSSIDVFKQDSNHIFHTQQQQQNVVLDGSDFSIITEIIVNSDNIPQEVTITQNEDSQIEELSVIEEHPQSALGSCPLMSESPSISQSPTLSQGSMSMTSTPTIDEEQQEHQEQQHALEHHIQHTQHHSQQNIHHHQQHQQHHPHEHQQVHPQPQAAQYQANPPPPPRSSDNFAKMNYLLDGFDDANRQRIERRILAYLCKIQLCELYNQDISGLNI